MKTALALVAGMAAVLAACASQEPSPPAARLPMSPTPPATTVDARIPGLVQVGMSREQVVRNGIAEPKDTHTFIKRDGIGEVWKTTDGARTREIYFWNGRVFLVKE